MVSGSPKRWRAAQSTSIPRGDGDGGKWADRPFGGGGAPGWGRAGPLLAAGPISNEKPQKSLVPSSP